MEKKNKNKSGNNKIETREFYVVWSRTYSHRVKPKWLHCYLLLLDIFKIHETPIYKKIEIGKSGNLI
jgi:hypothetical protein